MNKKFVLTLSMLLALTFAFSANAAILPNHDLIAPDSSFYFLQTWKESIQTFFTFGAENKAKQYLHLADVRLDEYKNMIEQRKIDIAQKTLDKYEKQLNQALSKAEELKNKGKDVTDLSTKIEQTVSKHLEILQKNLQEAPEQAKKGIENAIENSRKGVENVLGKKVCTQEAKLCSDGSAVGRTGPNCEFVACLEETTCKNLCGNGSCEEIVCMATDCPCPETKKSCPQDCDKKEKNQPSITVLSPNGGETFVEGRSYAIRWIWNKDGLSPKAVSNFSIDYYPEGREDLINKAPAEGDLAPSNIAFIKDANISSFDWTIPIDAKSKWESFSDVDITGKYRIRITTGEIFYQDDSDAPFSIQP